MAVKKRKICFVITSEIHYARNKLILDSLRRRKNVELQIVVGAGALLDYYGDVLSLLRRDNYPCHAKIIMTLQGGSPVAMAKTTGIGVTEFATVFDNLQPDLVVARGDRYEMLSAVIASAYLNIPIAHLEGGDVSGTIDESVRHAITKLSHIHFTTNEESKKRVLRMGEDPRFVFNFGSPEVELISRDNFKANSKLINRKNVGVGDTIDLKKQYMIVMQHPVTSEIGENRRNIEETLLAVYDVGIPAIWFWPNVDAGTDDTSKGIRAFRENRRPEHMRFIKYLPPEEFYGLLKNSACLVGNSSTGIKECSYLGIPVINIGTRQDGRTRGENVMDVGYSKQEIKKAIKKQIATKRYRQNDLFYKKNTHKNIADILTSIDLYTQKQFVDSE